jgi:hypothetical protein
MARLLNNSRVVLFSVLSTLSHEQNTTDATVFLCCRCCWWCIHRAVQDSQGWPHSNSNLQQIYIMQMSQLAESANAAAMLSTHSGLRFAEPAPGPSNHAGTGGSSSSRAPVQNSSSSAGGSSVRQPA